jgi:hypothetical protein
MAGQPKNDINIAAISLVKNIKKNLNRHDLVNMLIIS